MLTGVIYIDIYCVRSFKTFSFEIITEPQEAIKIVYWKSLKPQDTQSALR